VDSSHLIQPKVLILIKHSSSFRELAHLERATRIELAFSAREAGH